MECGVGSELLEWLGLLLEMARPVDAELAVEDVSISGCFGFTPLCLLLERT